MSSKELAREVLVYTTLLIDYISYYWNSLLCVLFHYLLGGPGPHPVHEASSTYHPAVLVTGASVGVGRDVAITLARCGYTVFATVRKSDDSDDLSNHFSQFENAKLGNLIPIIMDVTKKSDMQRAYNIVRNVLDRNTPFVGLINNASQAIYIPIEIASDAAFQDSFETNFFGVVNLTKTFLPLLHESSGRVINIGSISAWHSIATMGIYASTKAALRTLTRTWRHELLPLGVHMSLIEPGVVNTRLTQQVHQNYVNFTGFPTTNTRYHEIPHNIKPTVVQTYERQYRVIGRHCDEVVDNAMPAALVTDAIVNALTSPYPKAMYYVGLDTRFLATLNWLLGERAVDAIQTNLIGF